MIHIGYRHSNRRVQHDRFQNGKANYTTAYRGEVPRDAAIVMELGFAAFWESLHPSHPRYLLLPYQPHKAPLVEVYQRHNPPRLLPCKLSRAPRWFLLLHQPPPL